MGSMSKLSNFAVKRNSLSQALRRFSSTPRFNVSDDDDDEQPPQPIPNRPLRGQPPKSHSQSDHDFLHKFKLRPHTHTTTANPPPPPPPPVADNDSNSPPPEANDIFKKMKETGLIPNAVAMLDGLCKDGLVQEAMKLFALMRDRATIPEVVVYTAVIDGFFKAHQPHDAKRIFAKMMDNSIVPNAFTYTVLIQGLCKCNLVDDAVHFCLRMLDAAHSPNVATFVGLVDALCRANGVQAAQGVVHDLRKKGFYVNDKAVREFLDKNAPLSSDLAQAIFGNKPSPTPF
ncbi:pentatricopeptide repeat-containing protein At4g38150 [Mercurialis annua]|uniref:pentatricopeptide repeat-containing protein At4g38150 n=1 Tax=Mercurialis annua TaxID=3986 RepID=UPI00215E738A|nr:pentatricopeptide repeat-containing protein At4g38150 [Mercurialis annua]